MKVAEIISKGFLIAVGLAEALIFCFFVSYLAYEVLYAGV
jgi:hypothetical protein